MIYVTAGIFAVLLALVIIEEILVRRRGDCEFVVDQDQIDKKLIFEDDEKILMSFSLPIRNTGAQQGLLIDCKSLLQPEGDSLKNVNIHSKTMQRDNPRWDDYWEANIIKPGKECRVTVLLEMAIATGERIRIKENMSSFIVDINYKYYGRNPLAYAKCSINLSISDFVPSETPLSPIAALRIDGDEPRHAPDNGKVVPIKTHLLRPDDNIIDVIKRYTVGKAERGDIITIAESAVAIMQGRVYYVEDIRPRFLACRINKFFDKDSSLSSPYSLEMAFREVGVARIILATIIGILGKLIGRSGDFYRVAGKAAATIDDCTGTIPPYDKCIVLGPAGMNEVVRSIREGTGLEAAIVDVNDLRKVDILATTCPQLDPYLRACLERNPGGNANEQTPIVLLKSP